MLFVYCRRTASSLGEWRCMRMLRDLLEPFGTSSYTTKEKRQIPFKFCKLARHWQIFWHILPNISLRSSANFVVATNNSPKTLVFLKFFPLRGISRITSAVFSGTFLLPPLSTNVEAPNQKARAFGAVVRSIQRFFVDSDCDFPAPIAGEHMSSTSSGGLHAL